MSYSKADALFSLKPNAEWVWQGDSYSDIKWKSEETIPTEDEINVELTRLTNAEPLRLLNHVSPPSPLRSMPLLIN